MRTDESNFIGLGCLVLIYCVPNVMGNCSPQCQWSPWEPWSQCNASCGGGTRIRDRPMCCPSNTPSFEHCVEVTCGYSRYDCCETGACNTHCYNGGTFSSNRCNCHEANFGSCCADTIECGHPGTISNGHVIGNTFYFGDSVTHQCVTHFNLTDGDYMRTCQRQSPSSIVGVWSGSQPRCAYANTCGSNPCQNEGTCVDDIERYDCTCVHGWSGSHCELDVLPPSVSDCSEDREHLTAQIRKRVEWVEPHFYDEFGNDVTVTSNMPSTEADLPWGDNVIQFTGRKENNALTTTCQFTESVDPHPCEPLSPPSNGALACNSWNSRFAQICAYFCDQDWMLPLGQDIGQMAVCGATGNWAPRREEPHCAQPRIRSPDYHYFSGPCNATAANIRESFINILTSQRSPFRLLCDEFPEACDMDNVDVLCPILS